MAKTEDRDSFASLMFEPGRRHLSEDQRRASVVAHRVGTFAGSIEDLISEQLAAVEDTLAFNFAIAERLARERPPNSCEPRGRSSLRGSNGVRKSVSFATDEIDEADVRLSEPLLPKCKDNQWKGCSPIPKCSDCGDSAEFETLAEFKTAQTNPRSLSMNGEMPAMSEHIFPTFKENTEYVERYLVPAEPGRSRSVSIWARLAQNYVFKHVMLVVICLNTVWIAIETDYNKVDLLIKSDWEFQVVGNLFCTCFTFEVIVNLMAFKRFWLALGDAWFLFDTFLVVLMVWETWIETLLVFLGFNPKGNPGAFSVLRIFRVFRLLRVARTPQLLGSVPELLILAKGMVAAMRSVLAILSLLGLIVYIFAIVFTQLLAGTKLDVQAGNHFQSVPASANFLLLQVLCGFDWTIADQMWQESLLCYVFLLLYLLVGSLTIMNMLIGILCGVIFDVADTEKEDTFLRDMESKVESLAESLDVHGHGSVAKKEFEEVIHRPDVILEMTQLGVDVPGLMEFADFVYQENEELSYANFLHMVMQFRSGKAATLKDIMHMRKQVSAQFSKLLQACEASAASSQGLLDKLDRMRNWTFDSSDGSDELRTWYDGNARSNSNNSSPQCNKFRTLEAILEDHSLSPPPQRMDNRIGSSQDSSLESCPSGRAKETKAAAELFASYYIGQ